MLKYIKYIPGLLLLIMILVTGAYVPPTYAASADVVMMEIQAGGTGAALLELVGLYNNSPQDVDITNWCVKNKSNVAFACFVPPDPSHSIYLPAYSYATIGSTAMSTYYNVHFTVAYTSTNQSSGSIVGSSDNISLVDSGGGLVDYHSWTSSITGGMVFMREVASAAPYVYQDTDDPTDWAVQSLEFVPDDETELHESSVDVCPNIDGQQIVIPDGYEIGASGDCREKLWSIRLSEILPNATGSDEGREFIEIYNPNDHTIDLGRYLLWVGPAFEKSYHFPTGSSIDAGQYLSFTNSQIGFSLLNSSSAVKITADGETLDESPKYDSPDENASWAVVDGYWQYTNHPTPGAPNIGMSDDLVITNDSGAAPDTTATSSDPKPCADNQYRSPETNRCRLISSTTQSTLTPCKDGQYRSEETNRCRNIVADVAPAPCAEGQERNPDTNRCRAIQSTPSADYAVLGAQTSSGGNNLYVWLTVGAIVAIALAYGIWEWRYELRKLTNKLLAFVRIHK